MRSCLVGAINAMVLVWAMLEAAALVSTKNNYIITQICLAIGAKYCLEALALLMCDPFSVTAHPLPLRTVVASGRLDGMSKRKSVLDRC